MFRVQLGHRHPPGYPKIWYPRDTDQRCIVSLSAFEEYPMELKEYATDINKLAAALAKILRAKMPSDLELADMLREALTAAKAVSIEQVVEKIDGLRNQVQMRVDQALNERREVLLQAAKQAEVPFKRYGDYDRLGVFKVLYRGKKVRLEVGSEVFGDFEEVDGLRVFEIIRESRQMLESQPFDRSKFFRLLKHSYRVAKDEEVARDGWVSVQRLYAYLVLMRHINSEEFIKKPEGKKFQNYSTAQFVYDLARFGHREWTLGDEVLRTRTPNMATVASGRAMTLPNLDTVETLGPQLAVLRIEKREA